MVGCKDGKRLETDEWIDF